MQVMGSGSDNRVVLWERDKAHPNGEVFVTNDGKAVEVAETARVKRLLQEGVLVKVTKAKADVPPLRPATDAEEDAAGLTTPTEKETARVTVTKK